MSAFPSWAVLPCSRICCRPSKKKYPQITVSIMEKETNMLKEEILKKNLDLAFIDLYHIKNPEDTDNFEIFKIAASEIVIVASRENEVAQLKELQYSALNNRNLILFNDGHEYSGQVRNDMKLMGVKPNVVLSSTQWDFIMDMVANDIGIVLCPYYIYKKYDNPKICCIPLDEKNGQTGNRNHCQKRKLQNQSLYEVS